MAKMSVDRTGPAVPTGPTGILASRRRGAKSGGTRTTPSKGLSSPQSTKLARGR